MDKSATFTLFLFSREKSGATAPALPILCSSIPSTYFTSLLSILNCSFHGVSFADTPYAKFLFFDML